MVRALEADVRTVQASQQTAETKLEQAMKADIQDLQVSQQTAQTELEQAVKAGIRDVRMWQATAADRHQDKFLEVRRLQSGVSALRNWV
jgi:membrane-associated HD superfamily phosphohydrolase